MIYLNEKNIRQIGIDWKESVEVIAYSVRCLADKDYAQPVKPYLRYRNLKNRIIAMPAFIGGKINMAGIKWIASFPDNIHNGVPRAHSVVILNDAETGIPRGVLNAMSVSAIRTASVSGLVIREFLNSRQLDSIKVGIVGLGPIGRYHLSMCATLLEGNSPQFYLYDLKGVGSMLFNTDPGSQLTIVNSWEEAYCDADIFITCTVSKERYINQPPKPGSLHLNVSLRDYKTEVFEYFRDAIIVDDWEEICRENTDIENFHLGKGLQKEMAYSIQDVVIGNCLASFPEEQAIMFNPMGMAIFDIAIAEHYMKHARNKKIGLDLD
jgi:2,3-diaminopropionate biosynthesis protein SbnB